MKLSDIDDQHVIDLARAWQESEEWLTAPGVVKALVAEGVPEKLAVAKVERMTEKDQLEYGISPYYAWPR